MVIALFATGYNFVLSNSGVCMSTAMAAPTQLICWTDVAIYQRQKRFIIKSHASIPCRDRRYRPGKYGADIQRRALHLICQSRPVPRQFQEYLTVSRRVLSARFIYN